MAFSLGLVLAMSILPASSNVIKHWDSRHASLYSSGNAKPQARDGPDINVLLDPVAPSHTLRDHIEETISTGSEQARLGLRDPATVTISLGGIRTLINDDSNLPPPLITAISDKASIVDWSPQSEQDETKQKHLASTSIKTHGALAHPTDTVADAESSALPTSPPKGAIVPPPPVIGTGGEHTLDPLELRAVAANPIPTNHPTIVTIHAATKHEAAAVVTDLGPLEPRAVTPTSANPMPTNHPTLVTIHAATNGEAVSNPTNQPTLATIYASSGATGLPITAQRQVYTTYSSMTTCEYSPNTTVPFIATTSPPPLQAECQTHLSPVVTSYCSTTIPQLATTNITVTNCDQQVTYATSNGYSIISTGTALRNAPAIQTLTTYSAAVWDALAFGSTPTAGERVVCTQDGGCRSTRFFKGAAATNGSTATNGPYTMANSTGGAPYGLNNSTATARHFTVPTPFARGTGSYTVPPFSVGTAAGSSLARAANSTAPSFQWLNPPTTTTTPEARLAATQQPDAGGAGDFRGAPAPATVVTDTLRTAMTAPGASTPASATVITDTLTTVMTAARASTSAPATTTTSSEIDIGF